MDGWMDGWASGISNNNPDLSGFLVFKAGREY